MAGALTVQAGAGALVLVWGGQGLRGCGRRPSGRTQTRDLRSVAKVGGDHHPVIGCSGGAGAEAVLCPGPGLGSGGSRGALRRSGCTLQCNGPARQTGQGHGTGSGLGTARDTKRRQEDGYQGAQHSLKGRIGRGGGNPPPSPSQAPAYAQPLPP